MWCHKDIEFHGNFAIYFNNEVGNNNVITNVRSNVIKNVVKNG